MTDEQACLKLLSEAEKANSSKLGNLLARQNLAYVMTNQCMRRQRVALEFGLEAKTLTAISSIRQVVKKEDETMSIIWAQCLADMKRFIGAQ
jgi:RecA/RadA recombinase